MIFHTSQDDIDFSILNDLVAEGKTRWGLKFSGGADSALLAYMLVKVIVENNWQNTVTLHLVTGITKEWYISGRVAKEVIHKINDLTNTNVIVHHIIDVPPGTIEPDYDPEDAFIELISNGTINIRFSGINAYPTKDEAPLLYQEHLIHNGDITTLRKKEDEKKPQYKIANVPGMIPFINIDKKGIAELYASLNILDSLYPTTVSCHFDINHCGECGSCIERHWGFGHL